MSKHVKTGENGKRKVTVMLMQHPGKYWAVDEYKGAGELTIFVASFRAEDTFQSLFASQLYPGIDVLARNGKLHEDHLVEPSSR